jgi:hypothetical protein
VYDLMLILHFIGLALGVGTSFAMMNLGISTKDTPLPEKTAFFLKAFSLSKNGSIGLALLILSGFGMMFVKGPSAVMAWGGGMFHAKLALVAVLTGFVGYMHSLIRKAKKENGGPVMARIPKAGRIGLLLSTATVVLAVLAFH